MQHLTRATGNFEWYTPPEIIEAARRVLGTIDLDPASCAEAQEWIQARRWFGIEQDGLLQKWGGAVWLNPPYTKALYAPFIAQLIAEADSYISLTNASMDTGWAHQLLGASDAVCFTRGRIKYRAPGGITPRGGTLVGQALWYRGADVPRFRAEFARFGFVTALDARSPR